MAERSLPNSVISPNPAELAELLKAAKLAATRAYAPYSKFTVGAAILLADGKIISGCNVENASFSVTLCAERVAASTAIAAQQADWRGIVIVSPTGVSPCGACRQFLSEFAPELPIYYGLLTDDVEQLIVTNLFELLPAQMRLAKQS